MKINAGNKTIEIKKKHVYRVVFCGAIVTAAVYRKKYNTLSGEFDFLKLQSDDVKQYAADTTAQALNAGIANVDKTSKNFRLIYNY